ncbi:MAG: putative glycoside hydrolase [Oscillospiraceae bacterium]|nr:putative glycoside hydrolase [Oscillospiraceae bacterium]
MPYRPRDIYRGRRKFRVPLTILLSVLGVLLVGSVVLFSVLQRFVVYDASGVTLQLPSAADAAAQEETAAATPEPTFEPVAVEIIYETQDFSDTDLGGWEELESVQALLIPREDVVSPALLAAAVTRAQEGDYSGVVLEMKDETGQLAWASQTETAVNYGTYGTADVTETIAALHELGMTVAAQISCCADTLLGTRNWTVTLQTGSGETYTDSDGVIWLDPYNATVRAYLEDIVAELAAMGFDEIILADLYHPVAGEGESFVYSVTLQTDPDPVTAICLLGQRLVTAAEGTDTAVSVLLDASSLRNGSGSETGQDIEIFWRLFARLYCPTSTDMVTSDKELAVAEINAGSADIRFVPVCASVPEGCKSYVIK